MRAGRNGIRLQNCIALEREARGERKREKLVVVERVADGRGAPTWPLRSEHGSEEGLTTKYKEIHST